MTRLADPKVTVTKNRLREPVLLRHRRSGLSQLLARDEPARGQECERFAREDDGLIVPTLLGAQAGDGETPSHLSVEIIRLGDVPSPERIALDLAADRHVTLTQGRPVRYRTGQASDVS